MSKRFQKFALNFKHNFKEMSDQEFYESYNEAFRMIGFKDWTLTNLNYFKQWVSGDFLEVGCTGGHTLKAVKTLCSSCCGVDISVYALEEAFQTVPSDVKLVWADVEKRLPFPNQSFDTVLCGHTLEHLRDPKKAFNEMMRITRNKLIILIPLQGCNDRWKPTNMHIQFWATVKSFTDFCGVEAEEVKVLRDGTLAILLFRKINE